MVKKDFANFDLKGMKSQLESTELSIWLLILFFSMAFY